MPCKQIWRQTLAIQKDKRMVHEQAMHNVPQSFQSSSGVKSLHICTQINKLVLLLTGIRRTKKGRKEETNSRSRSLRQSGEYYLTSFCMAFDTVYDVTCAFLRVEVFQDPTLSRVWNLLHPFSRLRKETLDYQRTKASFGAQAMPCDTFVFIVIHTSSSYMATFRYPKNTYRMWSSYVTWDVRECYNLFHLWFIFLSDLNIIYLWIFLFYSSLSSYSQ